MLEQLELDGPTDIVIATKSQKFTKILLRFCFFLWLLVRYQARYSSRDNPASCQAETSVGRSRGMPAASEVRWVAGSTSCWRLQAYGRLSCGCTGSMQRQCYPNASVRPLRQAPHDRTSGLRKEISFRSTDTCNRRGHRCWREKISRDYGSSHEHI